MIKLDEAEYWDAVVAAAPEKNGLVNAMPIAEKLGIPLPRAQELCRKWFEQGRWTLMGSMSGTIGTYASVARGYYKNRKSCGYDD